MLVVSRDETIRAQFDDLEGVAVDSPPKSRTGDQRSGRIIIIDDDTILLSVVDDDGCETAIWSAGSLFASVLVQLIEASEEVHDPSSG